MITYSPKTPEQVKALSAMDAFFTMFTESNIKLVNSLLYKLINARRYSGTGLYVSDSALLGINKFSVYKKLFEVSRVLTDKDNFSFLMEKEFVATPLTGEEVDLFCRLTTIAAAPPECMAHFCAIFDKTYPNDFL